MSITTYPESIGSSSTTLILIFAKHRSIPPHTPNPSSSPVTIISNNINSTILPVRSGFQGSVQPPVNIIGFFFLAPLVRLLVLHLQQLKQHHHYIYGGHLILYYKTMGGILLFMGGQARTRMKMGGSTKNVYCLIDCSWPLLRHRKDAPIICSQSISKMGGAGDRQTSLCVLLCSS